LQLYSPGQNLKVKTKTMASALKTKVFEQ